MALGMCYLMRAKVQILNEICKSLAHLFAKRQGGEVLKNGVDAIKGTLAPLIKNVYT
jgi:hypothetical protein